MQRRHGSIAHFHRQIAARHHNAIGCQNDFIQVFNCFNALNFGNQTRLHHNAQFFALFSNGAAGDVHIFRVFHKAHRQIIAADFHRCFQIAEIFFGERACGQAAALFVDALVGFERVAVVANGVDFAADYFFYGNGEQAIIQQQHIACLHVVGQFAVIQAYALARAFAFQRRVKQQFFARFHLNAAACNFRHANFRALQIRHNRHF